MKKGDLVLCIKLGRWKIITNRNPLRQPAPENGYSYTVLAVEFYNDLECIRLVEFPKLLFRADRFKLVPPAPRFDFRKLVRKHHA